MGQVDCMVNQDIFSIAAELANAALNSTPKDIKPENTISLK